MNGRELTFCIQPITNECTGAPLLRYALDDTQTVRESPHLGLHAREAKPEAHIFIDSD